MSRTIPVTRVAAAGSSADSEGVIDRSPLTEAESALLAELEAVVHRGLGTFVEVGGALMKIRDGRLYRVTHATFKDYCRAEYDIQRAHAYRQIQAAQVVALLSPTGDIPTSERQARELAPMLDEPEKLRETWRKVVDVHGPRPTAAQVREMVVVEEPEAVGEDEGSTRWTPAGRRRNTIQLFTEKLMLFTQVNENRLYDLEDLTAPQARELLEKAQGSRAFLDRVITVLEGTGAAPKPSGEDT